MAGAAGDGFFFEWDPPVSSVRLYLEDWSAEVEDFTEPMTAISRVFLAHESKHLETEGAYTGDPFPPLSERYAEWKEWTFGELPILVLRGALRAAVLEIGAPGNILEITSSSLLAGVDGEAIPYARNHQEGGTVPERPPVRFDGDFESQGTFGWVVAQVLQAYVVWARKRALERRGLLEEDPFLDERFESRIMTAMSQETGSIDAIARLEERGLAELGLRAA